MNSLKILHILDHSIPLHSGYTFRTRAILEQQKKRGWETFQITSPKHKLDTTDVEEVDSLTFYRSKQLDGVIANLPVLNQWVMFVFIHVNTSNF